jgi:heptosyltransferase-2
VDAFLAGSGMANGTIIVLAPGSIWGSKRWPFYDSLAARLADRYAVIAIGGPEDVVLGDRVASAAQATGRGANACGKLTLRQSAALIGRAQLLITNDSVPLHLGTAMETPVVALFGPTIPGFGFGPIRPGDAALGVEGLQCRPCSPHGPPVCPLAHHRCMRELHVDAVLDAIEERLTSALRRRD